MEPLYPPGCEECEEGRRAASGCGCSWGVPWTETAGGPSHEGKHFRDYGEGDAGGATERPWSRTCPEWFYRSPFVQSVLAELPDYEAGRLGNVQDLPAPLVEYLRIASAEQSAWKTYQIST